MGTIGMKRVLLGTVAAAGLALATVSAQAAPVFVGSWIVGDGPVWTSNPLVYSGVEAAALLFGGSPSDYVISTVDSNPANINNMAYADTWGESIVPVAEDYSLSLCGGTYDCGLTGSATSPMSSITPASIATAIRPSPARATAPSTSITRFE